MKNNNQPVEDFLKQTWDKTTVPSRAEFKGIIEDVTKLSEVRTNQYEGSNQPSPYFMSWKQLGIGVLGAGVLAVLALVITPHNPQLIPSSDSIAISDTQSTSALEAEAEKYALDIPPADSKSSIDLAIRDIYLDAVSEAETAQADNYEDTDDTATLNEFTS